MKEIIINGETFLINLEKAIERECIIKKPKISVGQYYLYTVTNTLYLLTVVEEIRSSVGVDLVAVNREFFNGYPLRGIYKKLVYVNCPTDITKDEFQQIIGSDNPIYYKLVNVKIEIDKNLVS